MAQRHRIFDLMEIIEYLEEPCGYRFVDYYIFRRSDHFTQVLRMFYVSSDLESHNKVGL
jgi:hypothetical protein